MTHRWFDPWLAQFFPRIDVIYCHRIHSSLTALYCFMGKQSVAWIQSLCEYWLKELQESKNGCNGHHKLTEMMFKMTLNMII